MKNMNYDNIYDYLFIKTPITTADLLIVFGTTYGINKYVDGIRDIVEQKLTKTILITGKNESENIYNHLIQRDKNLLDKAKILLENNSTNTGENLQFSLPLLEKEFGKVENIKSIIGLGKDFVARRFLMTMAKYFPTAEKMFYPINVYNVNKENWYKNKELYQKCLNELQKLPIYLKKRYISHLYYYE